MKISSENLREALSFLLPPSAASSSRETSVPMSQGKPANTAAKKSSQADSFELSAAGEAALEQTEAATGNEVPSQESSQAEAASGSSTSDLGVTRSKAAKAGKPSNEATGIADLSEEEEEVVDELQARDREVRAHEQAHLAAAGPYARGGPTYTYQEGPDGQQYAVGGEVSIDTAPVSGDPEATVRKAQVVRAAALAPAEPSSQDRAVAAAATKLEIQARQELREQESGTAEDQPSADLVEYAAEATSGILLELIA